MLDVKELRVGNLIYHLPFGYKPSTRELVETYRSVEFVSSITPNAINLNFDYFEQEIENPGYAYKEIEGIAIAGEWLVKLGFEQTSDFDYQTRIDINLVLSLTSIHGGWEVFLNHGDKQCFSGTKVKYIHQIQNIYFVLAGRELIYTP